MDSLLQLSKYLPSEFQDKEKLLDILKIILGTRLLIDGIGSFQDEVPTLPLDMQRELIFNSHPYYANSFCSTSKKLLPICEQNKYKFFKEWCFPNMSLTELKKLLSRLTWNDVIKIALLYNPIPESLNYWDSINLAYYAIKNNQEDTNIYLKRAFDTSDHFLVSLICYKFDELDILYKFAFGNRNAHDYAIYMMLNYKLNRNIEPYPENMRNMKSTSFQIELIRFIDSVIPYIINTLFTYEDFIEFLIIHDSVFSNNRETNPYYTIINGAYPNYIEETDIFIMDSVQSYGFDNTDKLLSLYDKNKEVNRPAYNNFILTGFNKPLVIRYIMRTNSELMKENIPEQYRWIYYLTSGDIINYLSSKPLSYNNQHNLIDKYYGWNESGAKLINYV